MPVSGSNPESVTRPPWLSFLMEPAWTALEQAEAALRSIEGDLLKLDPESFRRMREGVNGPGEKTKLATKTRTGETWIELPARFEEVSASENDPSLVQTHPEDLEWLASEQRRIDAQRDRELSELQRVLEERLGAAAVDEIIGGADPRDLCRAAGIEITADLERILERLKGYQEDEG